MLVELKKLKPNPERDFAIDPMDDARVEELVQSTLRTKLERAIDSGEVRSTEAIRLITDGGDDPNTETAE